MNFNIYRIIRQTIIERTLSAINQLPDDKAREIADFADFVIKRYEEHELTKNIQQATSAGQAFNFLHDEEDIYTEADIKEKYDG